MDSGLLPRRKAVTRYAVLFLVTDAGPTAKSKDEAVEFIPYLKSTF